MESDSILFFLAPERAVLVLSAGPLLLVLSLLVLLPALRQRAPQLRLNNSIPCRKWGRLLGLAPWAGREGCPTFANACSYVEAERSPVPSEIAKKSPLVWLTLILLLGLGLRAYGIGYQELQADENVSWDAARGILRTGAPEAVSGVLYTRSPLYHYLLAGWLWLFGDTLVSARCFSLLPGVGVIAAGYGLALRLTCRPRLALLFAFMLAVDPWQVSVSGIIRFYQQMQFCAVLAVHFFLKGFCWREGKNYQNGFFLWATAAALSQEVFVTTFPAFALAFLAVYRPFSWRQDLNVWLGFAIMMAVVLIDISIFTITCLTPHVGVATTSGSIMQLNFNNLSAFAMTFFWMSNGANIFLSALFFLGLLYWLRYPNREMLFLYALVLLTVATLTILVLQVANRYCFSVYPIFVLAALLSADALIRRTARAVCWPGGDGLRLRRRWAGLAGGLVLAGYLANLEFAKMLDSYNRSRFVEHQSALTFISEQRRPGDKVMSVHPMEAAILLGGIDYYIMGRLSFDEVYQQRHGIVDRWAGGQLVSKLDQFKNVFRQHDRIWIVLDEFETLKLSPDVLAFLNRACSVEYEFFGGQVLLWDRTAGRYGTFRDRGAEADGY